MDNQTKKDDIIADVDSDFANITDRSGATREGESISAAETLPEHLERLPDIDHVEDYVGEEHIYDEETAGALAALMFAKTHTDESASKVAPLVSDEIVTEAEATVRRSPVAVLLIVAVVLVELLWGFVKTYPWHPAQDKQNNYLNKYEYTSNSTQNDHYENETVIEELNSTTKVDLNSVGKDGFKLDVNSTFINGGETDDDKYTSSSDSLSNVISFGKVEIFENKSELGSDETESVKGEAFSNVIYNPNRIEFKTYSVNVVEISVTPVQEEKTEFRAPDAISLQDREYFRGNLPELGDPATMRLVCLCELFAFSRIKKRESELLDECEGEDIYVA